MAPRATQPIKPHLHLFTPYDERMPTRNDDQNLLNAALTGYQVQKSEIEAQITNIRQRLGQGSSSGTGGSGAGAAMALEKPQRKKRHISAEGRRRIAEAQRKRWAATKKG